MPDQSFFDLLASAIPQPVKAALLAGAVALLRIIYDGKEPRWFRRLLESSLCGFIALGVSYLCQAIGLPSGWEIFLGGAIGLLGADHVREVGRRLSDERVR